MRKNKKGAMEMSIGTIVIIVLAMSMLILGMVLVKNIFGGATNLIDLNNQQILSEIAKIYGDDKKLVIYPSVDIFEVKAGETSAFAIRIKNLVGGESASNPFSYDITYDDLDGCGFSPSNINNWVKGESGSNIGIASGGEGHIEKILLEIPDGTALCTFKIRVEVKQNNAIYATEQMFIKIKG